MIREYDGAADLPDDMTNLLAVVNLVLLGVPYVHADYGSVDLSTVRPENILVEKNSVGGTTTTYFVPTRTLPLFGCRAARRPAQPLRDIGVPDKIVNVVEEPVRQLVDAGYDRASHENGGATVDSSAATPISLDAALNFNRWQWGITTRPSSTGTTSGAVTERVAERAPRGPSGSRSSGLPPLSSGPSGMALG